MKSLTTILLMAGASALLFTSTAMAASPDCPPTYETFEVAVPHVDLEDCPEAELRESAFCRASMGGEQVHLFYFTADGEQCLIKVHSFDEDAYTLDLLSP